MRIATEPLDVLLVADPGGHLDELFLLHEAWEGHGRRAWVVPVTVASDSRLYGEQVIAASGPTHRNVRSLVANMWLAFKIVRRLRPRVLLTTGAALGVPFAWAARLSGTEVLWVECAGRVGLSLSFRLASPAAHRRFVQWPELAGKGEFHGALHF